MPEQNGAPTDERASLAHLRSILQEEPSTDLPIEACGEHETKIRLLRSTALNKGVDVARKALEESPDLRSLLQIYNGYSGGERGPAKPLWGFDEPSPREWTIPGLVPEDFLSLLIADGGTGKSFLALYMALCIAVGAPFLKLSVKRGRVLYVDYELDLEEQRRRLWSVAAGQGLSVDSARLRERLYYLSPDEPVGTDAFYDQIREVVDTHDIDVIVLDSLTIGTIGDATSQKDIVPILRSLRDLPTLVAIDHVSHSTARGSASSARAFGSVFKRNIARSSLTLAQADGGGFLLQQEKSNFGPGQTKLAYAIDWGEKSITFRRVKITDDCMDGALSDMPTHDISLLAIKEIHEEQESPVSAEDLAAWRDENAVKGIAKTTAQNHFSELSSDGEIAYASEGGVVPKGSPEE